jgi:hypothetical protein
VVCSPAELALSRSACRRCRHRPGVPGLDLSSTAVATTRPLHGVKRRRDLAHDVYAVNYAAIWAYFCWEPAEPGGPDVLRGLTQQVYEPALTSEPALAAAKTRILSHFVHARKPTRGSRINPGVRLWCTVIPLWSPLHRCH